MNNPNPNQQRTVIIVLVAVLAILCLCACLAIMLGASLFIFSSEVSFPGAAPVATQDLDQQMDEIQDQVIQLRGLSPTLTVTRTLINTEQLRLNVTEDFLKDYSLEEAKEDALVLSAFGLLDADFDLQNFYLELYTEQIAGYYDHDTKEMFVVSDSGFNGPERLTYAHEFTHALQDQVYDLDEGMGLDDEACMADSERCLAIQALVEGDASLLEMEWFEEYATASDRTQLFTYASGTQSPIYEGAPAFMKEDFLFPYTQGYTFVESLHNQGGWEAVDEAYARPPVSSEQILHPELYPAEEPRIVTQPDFLPVIGEGWEMIDQGVMGEWYTYLILAHGQDPAGRVEAEQAQQAAAGWGGDAYLVYYHPKDQNLVMSLVMDWDSETDAQEFEQALTSHLDGRFGEGASGVWSAPEGRHSFARQGSRTFWLYSTDAQSAVPLWDLITSP